MRQAGLKAAETRRRNALAQKRSEAAKKAWDTRKRKAAGQKAAETRRKNAQTTANKPNNKAEIQALDQAIVVLTKLRDSLS